MPNIDIDSTKVRNFSNDLNMLINEYNQILTNLYSRINGVPTNTSEWTGVSAQNFVTILDRVDKQVLDALGKNLYEYAVMMNNLAEKIETTITNNRI